MFQIVIKTLFEGFGTTLQIFFFTLLGALPLGLIIAFGSMSKFMPLKGLVKTVVWVIRGTPLMLQLLVIYYGPGLLLHNNIWGGGNGGRMTAVLTAFIINYACYFSEIYRGGIESIAKGQTEAGLVLGMTKSQIFFKVILLQVIKRIVPPMSNEIITLVKDTSLSFTLSVAEMFTIAKALAASQTNMIPFVAAGIFYYVFNLIVAVVMEWIEKKLDYYR